MKNITYIFSRGRKNLYLNNEFQARDFFYGLTEFDSKKFNLNVIEFEDRPFKNIFIFKFLDKIMTKFFSLPFYTSKISSIKNLKILFHSDKIILINEGVGFSVLPMLIAIKLIKRVNVTLFVMGLYSKNLRYKSLNFAHNFFIKLLIYFINEVFFLGIPEMKKAEILHKSKLSKFQYVPFSIDVNFWSNSTGVDFISNDKIIFVGNDGNRDYELLIEIAKELKQFEFVFVTTNKFTQNTTLPNVKIVNGEWGSSDVPDNKLKDIYLSSRLCILPLKETFQPSGQSVSLQSMSLGIPVVISRTKGFWDLQKFIDEENIFFVEINNIESWVSRIKEIYFDTELLKKVSKNAKDTILKNYKLENTYLSLTNNLEI